MLFWNQTLRLFILKSLGKKPARVHPLVITAVSETWAQSLGGGQGRGAGEETHIHNSQFYENSKQTWVERPGSAEGQGAFGIQVPGQGGGDVAQLKWDATPQTTGGAGEKAQWVKSGCTSLWTRF